MSKRLKSKLIDIILRDARSELIEIDEKELSVSVLKSKMPGDKGKVLAQHMVDMGYRFKLLENLKIPLNIDGDTVAHYMVAAGYEFCPETEKDALSVANRENWTVAHLMAKFGCRFDPEKHRDILAIKTRTGWTVAHQMAKEDYVFNPQKHKDILLWATVEGWTVAHQIAQNGYMFDPDRDRDIVVLADKKKNTVAHWMAVNGYRFDPERHRDIVLLKNAQGETVAHNMALSGFCFDPVKHREICQLKSRTGQTVIDAFITYLVKLKSRAKHNSHFNPQVEKANKVFLNLSPEAIEEYRKASLKSKKAIEFGVSLWLKKIKETLLAKIEVEAQIKQIGVQL